MAQARRPQQPHTPPPLSGPGDESEPLPEELTGPESPPPAPPPGTSIRIGGREFTVEPELAAALEGRETEFNRKLSDQGREVGELRAWRRQVEERITPKPPTQEYNYDTQLFERPRETLEHYGATLEERIVSKIRGEYTTAEQQKRNWETFYKQNPDLADEERLVKAISAELMTTWTRGEDVGEFLAEVAKQTRGELLRISSKTRESEAPEQRLTRRHVAIEGGGGGGRRTPEPTEPTGPTTISDMIKARQTRHRAAVE